MMSCSGGFKSQQCQQLLTAPLRILFVAPPHAHTHLKRVVQASMSKGPSGITGGGGAEIFFSFSLFETNEICFGSTKIDFFSH